MKMRSGFLASALLAIATVSGPVTARAMPSCPRSPAAASPAAAGIRIVTAETPDGVALQFTTTGDVAALRARVHHMADMRNRMMGGRGMRMVPSHASVEDIPGGARLVLTPVDPSQLDALRAHASQMAAMMSQGRCPMFEAPAPPAPAGAATPQGATGV